MPWSSIGLHFAVFAATLVAGMVMFALGWIGGGDAKLFAVSGLWIGVGLRLKRSAAGGGGGRPRKPLAFPAGAPNGNGSGMTVSTDN